MFGIEINREKLKLQKITNILCRSSYNPIRIFYNNYQFYIIFSCHITKEHDIYIDYLYEVNMPVIINNKYQFFKNSKFINSNVFLLYDHLYYFTNGTLYIKHPKQIDFIIKFLREEYNQHKEEFLKLLPIELR